METLLFDSAYQLWRLFNDNLMLRAIYAFIGGALIGSFLNVVVYRYPKILANNAVADMMIMHPNSIQLSQAEKLMNDVSLGGRSVTPCCNRQIKAWHNIPIISWLLLKGRCGYCEKKISPRYLILELAMATVMASVALYGVGNSQLLLLCGVTAVLITVGCIDFKYQLIPTIFSVLLALFCILIVHFQLVETTMIEGLMSAISAYTILSSANKLTFKYKGHVMVGGGDIEFVAASSIALGFTQTFSALAFAVIACFLFNRKRKGEVTLGHYIAFVIWPLFLVNLT
ncbi:A24 family peptidase [Vibrio sp. 1180_3]|uniref:prepilin peptidase n=1 Tax=Vibrio sp. 1180_3 TaxID=2528832 RepID=UPI0024070888|nr:A24 family peptidase [Vibrio sp. 1180_3]